MADTAVRTMRLLSLLQRRRYWPGPELAARLEVSERTLRRDVERLRSIGYSVESDRGVDGGYRLESTNSGLAPLLVDNDEAVALAVGLHLAAQGSPELAEASVGALTKVLALLPAEQRRRAETVSAATAVGPGAPVGPPLGVLAVTAGACRDRVRLSFAYTAADGAETERYVEPYGLVALGSRYYLAAYDLDRVDWRTFRVDRMRDARPARSPFSPRPLPADDLREYVRRGQRGAQGRYRVVLEIEAPAEPLRTAYGRWVDVDELGPDRSCLTMDVDDFTWPLHILATNDAAFVVVEPQELRDRLAATAARFGAAN